MRQKFAKMLLDLGGNPNFQDHRGTTPLMQASIRGQDDLVQLLLANVSSETTETMPRPSLPSPSSREPL